MNVGRKLMLIVIASVALVTAPSAAVIYYFTKQNLLAREATTLVSETGDMAAQHTQNLMEAEPSLKALSRMLSKSLSATPQTSEAEAFDRLVQRDPDHAWRSRRDGFDGSMEAGMFLPPDAPLDAQQKILHLRSKNIMDVFGSSIHRPFSNVWLLTPGKTEIIYDHGVPDFALIIAANNDYTKTPWVTLGDPATNPERAMRWTAALYDPVPKSWMVSAVLPVDVNGRWIGNVGHDIYVSNLLSLQLKQSQRYVGEQHLLLDAQGNYIVAGPWQKDQEKNPESFRPDLSQEPELEKLLVKQLDVTPQAFKHQVLMQGRKYLAIGMIIQPVGWHYFRLVPIDEILAPIWYLFFALTFVVLMVGLLVGFMIEFSVKRNIILRLQALASTVRRYGLGDLSARAGLTGDDEIAKTSNEFDAMAEHLKATLEAIPDLLFDLGLDGRYYAAHSSRANLLAASPAELVGKTVRQVLPADAAETVMSALDEAHQKGWSQGKQFEMQLPQGKLWFELSVAKKATGPEQQPRFIVLSRNITERKLAEAEFQVAATAFEVREGIMISDSKNSILRVNKAFTTITGYCPEDVIGKQPSMLSSGRHDAHFYAAMWESLGNTGSWEGGIWNKRKNGEVYPQHLTITVVKANDGTIENFVATFSDITLNKLAEKEIQQLAFYDPLTGLPNRRLMLDRLKQAFAASARSHKEGALLFIDLDNFKTLNDTLGHDIGDSLLKQVADRLSSCVREGDTVARFGGDEFVLILEDLSEQEIDAAKQTEIVGEKILAILKEPYQLQGHTYNSTTSIGATLFQNHEQSLDGLLKQADIAMYQAKKAGRNTLRFFDPKMQASITARADLESELRKALQGQQFRLYYQIQVDSANRILGAEALIRWFHPERGMVSPLDFIPLAEESGLIVPIGKWVLDAACAQLKIWQADVLTRALTLSVNVSARQFHQADFVAQVERAVEDHAVNPKLLKLELTESILLENIDETIAIMSELREIGVCFSLDDFGTGYSSLQYLKRLPLDQLKIDQSFVRDLAADSSDKAIVKTIIAMAQGLNLEVIAEGVETEEQRLLLLSKDCHAFQGYLFSKPLPIDEFAVLLRQW